MAISNITPMPTAPTRTDPTNFSTNSDAWLSAFTNTFVPQFNTAITGINAAQTGADVDAATATSGAVSANAAATSVAATAKAVGWVSGNTYQQNDCAISQVNFQTYRKKVTATVNSGGATDPANDPSNWQQLSVSNRMLKVSRSTNTSITNADFQTFFDLSGTFTQTFAAASTFQAGWYCFLRNGGSGFITLSTSDLIEGGSTITMMPAEVRVLQCSGTTFSSLLINTEGYLNVRDEKPQGFAGGAGTGGMPGTTRTLNAVKYNTMSATLSGNQITLLPGTYRCKISVPFAAQASSARAYLNNDTDGVIQVLGTSEYLQYSQNMRVMINGQFTITSSKVFSVRMALFAGTNQNDYGIPANISGLVEVYTEAEFWKIG